MSEINILFSGDIAIQSRCPEISVDEELKMKFINYDHRCCNFEAPICTNSDVRKPKAGPSIRQHPDSLRIVETLGFNLFALANNHIMDYGKEGLFETMNCLNKISENSCFGAGFSRDEALSPYIVEKDHLRIGLISVAENSFGAIHENTGSGHAWIFDKRVHKTLKCMKKDCDFVIIICHAGAEHLEIPLPEWRAEYRSLIEMGADVIIGHHPHVIQGWEEIGGKPVFYSLGNFLWQRPDNKRLVDVETMCVGFHFEKRHMTYEIIPMRIKNNQLMFNHSARFLSDLESWKNILNEKNEVEYLNKIDEFCTSFYRKVFKHYIYSATGNMYVDSFTKYIKMFIKSILNRPALNNLFVYHNVAVETNNWICQRAIRKLENL